MELESKELTKLSKFISFVLRHKPEVAKLDMDEYGWVKTEDLIKGLNEAGYIINLEDLTTIVDTDNKSRYSFNNDRSKIRANQGHSIKVNLELSAIEPPHILYHGTASKFLDNILKEGIKSKSRVYVHLSLDKDTAIEVGSRHGQPVVLTIDTKKMYEDGLDFYLSENGVWLTDFVDKKYIKTVSV